MTNHLSLHKLQSIPNLTFGHSTHTLKNPIDGHIACKEIKNKLFLYLNEKNLLKYQCKFTFIDFQSRLEWYTTTILALDVSWLFKNDDNLTLQCQFYKNRHIFMEYFVRLRKFHNRWRSCLACQSFQSSKHFETLE